MSRDEAANMLYPGYLPSYQEAINLPITDPNAHLKPPEYEELIVDENLNSNVGNDAAENTTVNSPGDANEPTNSLNDSILDTRSNANLVSDLEQDKFEH